jgi:hypothetical protein
MFQQKAAAVQLEFKKQRWVSKELVMRSLPQHSWYQTALQHHLVELVVRQVHS